MAVPDRYPPQSAGLSALCDELDAFIGSKQLAELPRRDTLQSLVKRLKQFSSAHFEFFYERLVSNPGVELDEPDDDYVPETILRPIIIQTGHDLEVITQAMSQRLNGTQTMRDFLTIGDYLAGLALVPAKGLFDKLPFPLTYFQRSSAIRVIPYAPVAVVAFPFSGTNHRSDLLAIAHEVGHYVFWHGKPLGNNTVPVRQTLRERIKYLPDWLNGWLEEIFADVYGCVVAGQAISEGFQDLAREFANIKFIYDDGHRTPPAIRPYLYIHALRRCYPNAQADRLEGDWDHMMQRRKFYGKPVVLSAQVEALASDPAQRMGQGSPGGGISAYSPGQATPTLGTARALVEQLVDAILDLYWPGPVSFNPPWPADLSSVSVADANQNRPGDLNPGDNLANLYTDWEQNEASDITPPPGQSRTPVEMWRKRVFANGWTTEGANGFNPNP